MSGDATSGAELERKLSTHFSRRFEIVDIDGPLVECGLSSDNPRHVFVSHLILTAAGFRTADFDMMVKHIGAAMDLYKKCPEIDDIVAPSVSSLFTYHALSLEIQGDLGESWTAMAKAVMLAADRDEIGGETDIVIHNLALNEILSGNFSRATRLISYGRRIFVSPQMAALFALLEMELAFSEGLFDEAIAMGLRIRNLITFKHAVYNTVVARMLLDVYVRSGRIAEARIELERLKNWKEPPNYRGWYQLMCAEVALAQGSLEQAQRHLNNVESLVDRRFGRQVLDRKNLDRAQLYAARQEWEDVEGALDQIDLATTRELVASQVVDLRILSASKRGDIYNEVSWLSKKADWRQGRPRVRRSPPNLQKQVDAAIDKIWAGRLERASEQRANMLQLIDHDLRGLVATQEAAFGLLEQGQTHPSLDAIAVSARSISDLSDVLAMVGSLDAGDLALSRERVSVVDVLQSVHSSYLAAAQLKQQTFCLDVAESAGATVSTDARLLGLTVSNLVSNAIKYVQPGGSIVLRSSTVGPVDQRLVRIEVVDDGPGLESADLASIFGRYATGSARSTAGESSLGLGLYLVAALSQVLGLGVQARSPGVGLGSTFVIELPEVDRELPGSSRP